MDFPNGQYVSPCGKYVSWYVHVILLIKWTNSRKINTSCINDFSQAAAAKVTIPNNQVKYFIFHQNVHPLKFFQLYDERAWTGHVIYTHMIFWWWIDDAPNIHKMCRSSNFKRPHNKCVYSTMKNDFWVHEMNCEFVVVHLNEASIPLPDVLFIIWARGKWAERKTKTALLLKIKHMRIMNLPAKYRSLCERE